MALTPRQARFVEEYLVDLNATQAARRAGYSPKTANEQGSQLLANLSVQEALAEAQAARSRRTEITADRVLDELAKVGFANMLDYIRITDEGDAYVDFSTLNRDQAAALQEITVEEFKDSRGEDGRDIRRVRFKLADKLGALGKIADHLGMLKKRVEVTGAGGAPIETHDLTDKLARLPRAKRDAVRAAIKAAMED